MTLARRSNTLQLIAKAQEEMLKELSKAENEEESRAVKCFRIGLIWGNVETSSRNRGPASSKDDRS